MAELKRTFVSGRMDKDSDERIIENGSYRDALNIHVSSSEGSDSGAVENLLGNKKISNLNLTNPKVIGSLPYSLKDKIYWFCTSDTIDAIYEYDQIQKVISPIIIDTKSTGKSVLKAITVEANSENELTIENVVESELKALCGALPINELDEVLVLNNLDVFSSDPYINLSIPKNTTLRKEDNKFVFKNIPYNNKDFGNIDLSFVYSSEGVLNFSKNNLITGINIIDDMLFWTDNLNPPRKINISNFKKFSKNVFDSETKVQYVEKDTSGNLIKKERTFNDEDISVAKKAPMYAPSLDLDFTLVKNSQITKKINFYSDASAGSDSGQKVVNVGEDFSFSFNGQMPSWEINSNIILIETGPAENKEALEATASVKKIDSFLNQIVLTLKSKNIDFENKEYNLQIELVEKEAIYKSSFVRFGYRWKYKDGEYSTISPFSEPAFIPQDFKYDGKNGFNKGMESDLRKIILSEFDLGSDNVDEIEILFKETRNQNIYTLKSQKKIDFLNSYEITKKQIHSVLPNDQLLRAWDNVPKKAKAQEVTANRIIYGNYTQNYDIYNDIDLDIVLEKGSNNFKRTIKSNRTYQIGVVYIDEYNRHSPVLSNQTGAINIPKKQSTTENAFSIKINSKPPAWAKYFKYYIKDPSKEYYNIAADKFYNDTENGFSYISFPSSERNKVTEETYLLLKKAHGTDEAILDEDNKYKIISLFNEAPDFVANTLKKQVYSLSEVQFASSLSDVGEDNVSPFVQTTLLENSTPVEGSRSIIILASNDGDGGAAGYGISKEDKDQILTGRFIQFQIGTKKSKVYEISSLNYNTKGIDDLSLRIKGAFGSDVNFLYTGTTLKDNISINIIKNEPEKAAKEFDGRFFAKVELNSTLLNSELEDEIPDNLISVKTFELNGKHQYRNDEKRRGSGADETPRYPIFISKGGLVSNSFKKNNIRYNLIFEEATVNQDPSLIDTFKPGVKLKFRNDEAVYEIGKVFKENFNIGTTNLQRRSRRQITRVYVQFVDENGNFKYLEKDILEGGVKTDDFVVMNVVEEESSDKISFTKNPAIFETEPIENTTDLDIYYETEKAYEISGHGDYKTLKWYNAFCFGNGVESNRIRDDFNAPFISSGVKASSVISQQIKEEHKFNGLIWSGIINSRSSVNKSNEFNQANTITKDLLPSYGSIQKLHAWDDQLIMLCEDKIVRALADKDILYNADGNTNVVATNRVIGAVQPYNGEYGISQNPESFAFYGFRCYFADRMRGAILRLSKDGLTPISDALMSDFFKDRFFDTGCYNSTVDNSLIVGSYDNYNNLYNLSFIGRDTVCFKESTGGWVTRKSFIPENGISLNNTYYTYSKGDLWQHDDPNVPYNNFYGEQYGSKIELELNDSPSAIKSYKTLGYEGSAGWTANIVTDQQKSNEISFKEKENKYFAYINGEKQDVDNLDFKNFNFQGIGKSTGVSEVSAASDTTLSFEIVPKETEKYTSNTLSLTNPPGEKLNSFVNIVIYPKNGYSLDASNFNLANVIATQDGDKINLKYTHGVKTQPTSNISKTIELCSVNFANKKNITISGDYTVDLENVTSDVNNGSYSISSNAHVFEIIKTRTLTPNTGWKITEKNISVDNPLVKLTKKLNKDGSITVTEKIIVPETSNENIDYKITVIADEIIVDTTKISSISIPKDPILPDEGERNIIVSGDPGGTFSVKVVDDNDDVTQTETDEIIPEEGEKIIPITLPEGDDPDNITITVTPGENTDADNDVDLEISINKPAVEAKTITLFSQFKNNISNKNKLQAFTYDDISNSFTQTISLPSGSYSIFRQPLQSDFILENNKDSTILSNLEIELDDSADEVTLKGDIDITNVQNNNKIILILDNLINEQVTLSIDYNTTILGGAATIDYTKTSPASAYTISGAAGLDADKEDEYLFTLTPSAGKEFISDINANDFEITDSSSVVTSTYADNSKMKVLLEDDKLKVGFVSKSFDLPSSSKTIYVRPKKQIAQTISVTSGYSILYEKNKDSENIADFTSNLLQGELTDSSNQNFLFQKTFTINRDSNDYFKNIFSSSGHVIDLIDSELSVPGAGTYTDINGDSVTITGQIEYNSDKTELTLNTLANISGSPSKQLGRINVKLLLTTGKRHNYRMAEGDCSFKPTYSQASPVYLWNKDPNNYRLTVGARITTANFFNPVGFSNGDTQLERTVRIPGSNYIITLEKENAFDVDKIKDVSVCSTTEIPKLEIDDIVKTYGDPNFTLNATSNSGGQISYKINNSNGVASITSNNTVNILKAGDTTIKVTQKATANYHSISKIINLKVRKTDPIITTVDISKNLGDDDFDITIEQP